MPTEIRQRVIRHWHSFKNPLINDILINLEKLETQLPEITPAEEQKVQDMLEGLEKCKADDIDETALIEVLNKLPIAYMLYIIHKLQQTNTDVVMKVIQFAQKNREKSKMIDTFFQRNMVFEKSQLLGRIFSSARMNDVLKVL